MLTGPALGAAIERARLLKGVTKKALADAFDVQPPSVQDWVRRGTIDKDKLPKLWAYFRDVVGPDHWGLPGWTDPQPVAAGVAIHPVAHELSPGLFYAGVPTTSARVPVIGTLELATSGQHHLVAGSGGVPIGAVDAHCSGPNSFALRVVGDDLYPAVRHGACLVIEPDSACVEGELVLIELSDGNYLVRELVAQRDDSITVLPLPGGGRSTLPRSKVAAMHPVASVVAASKFRPA